MRNRSTFTLGLVCAALLINGSAIAEVPGALESIVLGDEKRPVVRATINGVVFETLTNSSGFPTLAWPSDEVVAAPIAHDRALARAWLDRAAGALGYEGFAPRYRKAYSFRGNDVWTYELVRRDLVVHDARVEVHWDGKTFLGIFVHLPRPIVAIEDGAVRPNESWVYYPERVDRTSYRIVPARVERTDLGDRVELSITWNGGTARRVVPAGDVAAQNGESCFDEFAMPVGVFPDQVSVDPDGIVWLSQPNNNLVTEFDPFTEAFVQHATTGGQTPDGLIVGTEGRVWTGLYGSGALGVYDSDTGTFQAYAAPYGGAQVAIPVETSDGHVWVTDHIANRVSEFDPATGVFIDSVVLPTPGSWVVQGYEGDDGFIYFTEYTADQLGRIPVGGGTFVDIPTPGGGPAFCVYLDGHVYYSRWTESGIGVLDVASGVVTEYEFPVADEFGGPMWLTSSGLIVTGTRNVGYIMVFDPDTETFEAHQIPTVFPGLKDGLTVAPDDTIWFTESGANILGRLTLASSPCDGDIDDSGDVNVLDLISILGAWGPCGGCPQDIDGSGAVDILDLLTVLAAWGDCP